MGRELLFLKPLPETIEGNRVFEIAGIPYATYLEMYYTLPDSLHLNVSKKQYSYHVFSLKLNFL